MNITVIIKEGHIQAEQVTKAYIQKRLKKVDEFFGDDNELNATVVLKVFKNSNKVEITIPAHGFIMRAEVSHEDLLTGVDKAVDKLLQQVRKYKARLTSKSDKENFAVSDTEEKEIVKRKQIDIDLMTPSEAISQMELLGHDFFVFINKETHKVNVVYLRNDGKYAVIEQK